MEVFLFLFYSISYCPLFSQRDVCRFLKEVAAWGFRAVLFTFLQPVQCCSPSRRAKSFWVLLSRNCNFVSLSGLSLRPIHRRMDCLVNSLCDPSLPNDSFFPQPQNPLSRIWVTLEPELSWILLSPPSLSWCYFSGGLAQHFWLYIFFAFIMVRAENLCVFSRFASLFSGSLSPVCLSASSLNGGFFGFGFLGCVNLVFSLGCPGCLCPCKFVEAFAGNSPFAR